MADIFFLVASHKYIEEKNNFCSFTCCPQSFILLKMVRFVWWFPRMSLSQFVLWIRRMLFFSFVIWKFLVLWWTSHFASLPSWNPSMMTSQKHTYNSFAADWAEISWDVLTLDNFRGLFSWCYVPNCMTSRAFDLCPQKHANVSHVYYSFIALF